MGWDGTGIICYGMGMGQVNMSHGQTCKCSFLQYCIQYLSVGTCVSKVVRLSTFPALGYHFYFLMSSQEVKRFA